MRNDRETEQAVQSPPLHRIGIFGVGVLAHQTQMWFFDYVIYPFVIWYLGLLIGAVAMTFLSFSICYGMLRFYDWSKKDWLGIETVKSLKENESSTRLARVITWILNKGGPAAMLLLSIKFDAFVTTAYMRQGNHLYDGLSNRNWKIFLGSLLIGNAYRALAVFTGISIVEWLWLRFTTIGS